MAVAPIPPPIPGQVIDPPPKAPPERVQALDGSERVLGTVVGIGYRSFLRYSHAKVPLLAAGTTYYLFLAMFSVVAFAYGITAALGADGVAEYLTEALGEAFPGLVGDQGIDPDELRAVGQATSLVGAAGLLYGGTGAVTAVKMSMHLIYGAPKDPRTFVLARLRALGWLAVLGPLILLSFVASSVTSSLSETVLGALGIDWAGPSFVLGVASLALTLGVNFLIVHLLINHLGGIRPPRRARLVGAGVGAVLIEALKMVMALLVGLTIDKPQYGAFAAPIGVLFVLYLQSTAMYGCAALTAGIADRDVPLAVLRGGDGWADPA